MRVTKDRVVCMDYTIRLTDGQVVESSVGSEPLRYLHGRRQIVPGVERAVEGLEPGDTLDIIVPPEDAYGERDPSGIFLVPRGAFPVEEEIGAGMTFAATRPDGQSLVFRVVETNEDVVLVDTNHPLAGQTLHVAVLVHHVRGATADELRNGQAGEDQAPEPTYLA